MAWTTEQPKARGLYWAYRGDSVEMVRVIEKAHWFDDPSPVEYECWPVDDERPFALTYYTHWSGPIEAPSPPIG